MTNSTRDRRLVAVLAFVPMMAGCSLIPPEGPSLIDQRPKIDSGPSAQRLGPDGYPLLGAFPNTAASQLGDSTVASERDQLKSAAGSQNATAAPAASDYQRSVAESKALQAKTNSEVEAAVAQARGTDGPLSSTSDDVLRKIEGR